MQPIKDRGDAVKRAKRLAKSLRRRRDYVNNLRQSAREEREHEDPIHAAFALMIDDLADREIETARIEQNEANVVNAYLEGSHSPYAHETPEERRRKEEKHVEVMQRMEGRFASDRRRHLAGHLGVTDHLPTIEAALGLERGDNLFLKRLELAEIAAFGAVRFE